MRSSLHPTCIHTHAVKAADSTRATGCLQVTAAAVRLSLALGWVSGAGLTLQQGMHVHCCLHTVWRTTTNHQELGCAAAGAASTVTRMPAHCEAIEHDLLPTGDCCRSILLVLVCARWGQAGAAFTMGAVCGTLRLGTDLGQAFQGPFCGVIRAARHERAVEVQQPVGIILLWWGLVADECCRADQAKGSSSSLQQ